MRRLIAAVTAPLNLSTKGSVKVKGKMLYGKKEQS